MGSANAKGSTNAKTGQPCTKDGETDDCGQITLPKVSGFSIKTLLPASYSLRMAQFCYGCIIAGDIDWNKANNCDCSISVVIPLFAYILLKQRIILCIFHEDQFMAAGNPAVGIWLDLDQSSKAG